MLPVKIAGLGCYLPERRVTNADLEAQLGIPAEWIERVTGVQERRYVTNETTVGMGCNAARMALEAAGLHVADLDAIISASTGAQQAIPLHTFAEAYPTVHIIPSHCPEAFAREMKRQP